MVTPDVVGLYPSIPHEVGLRALREALNKKDKKTIPTEELLKMVEFALKNNYFEFGNKIKQQISGTAIGTKFVPFYAIDGIFGYYDIFVLLVDIDGVFL